MDTMLEFLVVNVLINMAAETFGDRGSREFSSVFAQVREEAK